MTTTKEAEIRKDGIEEYSTCIYIIRYPKPCKSLSHLYGFWVEITVAAVEIFLQILP